MHVLLSLGMPPVKWLAKVFKIKQTCTNTNFAHQPYLLEIGKTISTMRSQCEIEKG